MAAGEGPPEESSAPAKALVSAVIDTHGRRAHRGIEDCWIKLGCVMPGETPGIFGDALRRLAGSSTYLYPLAAQATSRASTQCPAATPTFSISTRAWSC